MVRYRLINREFGQDIEAGHPGQVQISLIHRGKMHQLAKSFCYDLLIATSVRFI